MLRLWPFKKKMTNRQDVMREVTELFQKVEPVDKEIAWLLEAIVIAADQDMTRHLLSHTLVFMQDKFRDLDEEIKKTIH